MTHSDHHQAGPTPGAKTERLLVRGFGVTLAVAGVLSAIHLADQYRQAAPYREAKAAERALARAAGEARDAEWRAERDANQARYESRETIPSPRTLQVPTPESGDALRLEDMSPEVRREIERAIAARGEGGSRPAPSAPTTTALRWSVEPDWPLLRNDDFPPGVARIEVLFRCRVTRDGALTGCNATERPVGSGLAARMRPALNGARMEPMIVDGRRIESTASFGVSFNAPPRRVVVPPPPTDPGADKAPVYMPSSPLPSADRLTTPIPVTPPAPEPAPAG